MPKGAAVYQLPYVYFPEDLTSRTGAYEPARGYLHSSRLRWSWGAMRGRPADWASRLAGASVPATATAVAAAGFEGIITVDRRGYADGGSGGVSALTSVLRAPGTSSPDGRFGVLRSQALREQSPKDGDQRVAVLRRSTLGTG